MARAATGGTNLEHARLFNRRVVLETIRLHGPLSRASIARQTGLSVQTISNITDELSQQGLLREGALRQGGGRGAPAIDLSLNPDGGFTFGISVDHRRLFVVLVDITGVVRRQVMKDIEGASPDQVLADIGELARTLARQEGAETERLWGAGVVMPMALDNGRPIVVGPTSMPDAWHQLPVIERLSASLQMPVLIENDATAAAMAEYYQQPGETNALITLLVNYGIGSGLVLAGQPFRGGHGNAGEVGAFYPLDRPRPSGTDLLKRLQAEGVELRGLTDIDYTDPRHRAVCDIWSRDAGTQLRDLIASAWSWLDPERIVLSGPLPPALLQRLVADIGTDSIFAQHPDRPAPQVVPSTLGAEVAALGAAHIPLHAFTGQMGTI